MAARVFLLSVLFTVGLSTFRSSEGLEVGLGFASEPNDAVVSRNRPLLLNCEPSHSNNNTTVHWTFNNDLVIPDTRRTILNNGSLYIKKVKASQRTGAGTSQLYSPRLWYYDYLTFMDEREPIAHGIDTEDNAEINVHDESTEVNDEETGGQEAVEPPPVKKVRKGSLEKKKEKLIDSVQKLMDSDESEWDVIGKSLGLQISKLQSNQRDYAQKLISDVIFFGKRGQLNDNSSVTVNSSIPATPTPGPHIPSIPHGTYPNYPSLYIPTSIPTLHPYPSQSPLPFPISSPTPSASQGTYSQYHNQEYDNSQ